MLVGNGDLIGLVNIGLGQRADRRGVILELSNGFEFASSIQLAFLDGVPSFGKNPRSASVA